MIVVEKIDNNIDHVRFTDLMHFNALVADKISRELTKLFEIPNSKVIIDLDGVRYIDSSGFGCFLSAMKSARNNYGILKFCNIDPEILSVFNSLQLNSVLELYNDFDSCMDSF